MIVFSQSLSYWQPAPLPSFLLFPSWVDVRAARRACPFSRAHPLPGRLIPLWLPPREEFSLPLCHSFSFFPLSLSMPSFIYMFICIHLFAQVGSFYIQQWAAISLTPNNGGRLSFYFCKHCVISFSLSAGRRIELHWVDISNLYFLREIE